MVLFICLLMCLLPTVSTLTAPIFTDSTLFRSRRDSLAPPRTWVVRLNPAFCGKPLTATALAPDAARRCSECSCTATYTPLPALRRSAPDTRSLRCAELPFGNLPRCAAQPFGPGTT